MLSTFLFALELYRTPAQWYITRQRLLPAVEAGRILGVKAETYFLEAWLGSHTLDQHGRRFEDAEWGCTFAAVIFEDGPQLILNLVYTGIVGFDSSDEVAVLSLTLSLLGIMINLAIILGCWKFSKPKLQRLAQTAQVKISNIRQDISAKRSVKGSRTKHNPVSSVPLFGGAPVGPQAAKPRKAILSNHDHIYIVFLLAS